MAAAWRSETVATGVPRHLLKFSQIIKGKLNFKQIFVFSVIYLQLLSNLLDLFDIFLIFRESLGYYKEIHYFCIYKDGGIATDTGQFFRNIHDHGMKNKK